MNHQTGILKKNLSLLFALGTITSFFLNWVKWGAVPVSAKHMATGYFYTLAETYFGIANPFPQLVFANAIFWLIPALALVVMLIVLLRKTYAGYYGAVSGAMVLGLAFVYALFTRELNMFDNSIQLKTALRPGFYLAIISAVALILCSWQKKWVIKILFLLPPLAISYLVFSQIKQGQVSEKTAATNTLATDFTVDGLELIKEFVSTDSAANAKYRNKVVLVNGLISELNATDSTASISMADSTGSYTIFDFEKEQAAKVKTLKVGDKVSIKGICSGSIYSDILETQTISFKQAIIHN